MLCNGPLCFHCLCFHILLQQAVCTHNYEIEFRIQLTVNYPSQLNILRFVARFDHCKHSILSKKIYHRYLHLSKFIVAAFTQR